MVSILRTCLAIALVLPSAFPLGGQSARPDTSGFADVAGARLYFRSVGTGKPLVIVHGGPGMSHDYLAPQLITLLADEYRLIFYDQRASGRSTGVEDTTRLTMAQFVEDLEDLRRELGLGRLNVLGHSFGGLLAMHYAVAHPTQVERLLLIDTSPASWELNFPHFRRTIAARQTANDRRRLAALQAAASSGKDPKDTERYLTIFFRTFFHNAELSDSLALNVDAQWIANNRVTGDRIWGDLGRYDFHDRLQHIVAPTLILHGTASVIAVDGARAIANRIPNSQLIVLKDVGHFPYIEAPQAFAAAVKAFVW